MAIYNEKELLKKIGLDIPDESYVNPPLEVNLDREQVPILEQDVVEEVQDIENIEKEDVPIQQSQLEEFRKLKDQQNTKQKEPEKKPSLTEKELTLQALKRNIEEMQKEPEKRELTAGDYLPDVLAGLYNIYNFAQGSRQPSMKIGSIEAARKAQEKEEASRQAKLGKMQKLYTDYLGLLGKSPTEKEKIELDIAKEKLKELKEPKEKEKIISKFEQKRQTNIADRYAELEAQVPEKLSSIKEAEFLLDKIERDKLDTGFGQEFLGKIGSVFQTKESSYKERLDALAEKAARAQLKAMGEIRPTDADVEGMKKALFNVANTEETNINKLKQFINQQKAGLDEYQQMKKSLETGKGLEKFIQKEKFVPQKEIKERGVRLRSPNGRTAIVKGSEVQKYLDKGAVIVKD